MFPLSLALEEGLITRKMEPSSPLLFSARSLRVRKKRRIYAKEDFEDMVLAAFNKESDTAKAAAMGHNNGMQEWVTLISY